VLLTGLVCVKMIGNRWTACSFIVLLPVIYGPLYLFYLAYPELFLNKWLSCLLVGIVVLGDIGQHLFGVLFCSILCGTYGENRIIESLKGRSVLL